MLHLGLLDRPKAPYTYKLNVYKHHKRLIFTRGDQKTIVYDVVLYYTFADRTF